MTMEAVDMLRAGPEGAEAPEEHGVLSSWMTGAGSWSSVVGRSLAGLGLAAIFGLALGLRDGRLSLLQHAPGVTAAPLVIMALGVPALYIVLASFDVPLGALDLARSAARGTVALGAALAGIAPLTALYVVSGETRASGALVAVLALVFGGAVRMGHFLRSIWKKTVEASAGGSRLRTIVVLCATVFAILCTVTAARVWFGTLPIFRGDA